MTRQGKCNVDAHIQAHGFRSSFQGRASPSRCEVISVEREGGFIWNAPVKVKRNGIGANVCRHDRAEFVIVNVPRMVAVGEDRGVRNASALRKLGARTHQSTGKPSSSRHLASSTPFRTPQSPPMTPACAVTYRPHERGSRIGHDRSWSNRPWARWH